MEHRRCLGMLQCASAAARACTLHLTCACAATCILFGDGCGAVLLTATSGHCHLLGSSLHSDGNGQKHLRARRNPETLRLFRRAPRCRQWQRPGTPEGALSLLVLVCCVCAVQFP